MPADVQVIVARPLNRVVRYRKDEGIDLTAVLRWCATHNEAVWVFGDGSFSCPHDLIIQYETQPHDIIAGIWEMAES